MREPWAGASAGTWSEADTWKVINNPGFAPYFGKGKGINGEIRYSEHLHVSCFDINWEKVPYVARNPIANSHLYDDMVQKMVNPFNHDERY